MLIYCAKSSRVLRPKGKRVTSEEVESDGMCEVWRG